MYFARIPVHLITVRVTFKILWQCSAKASIKYDASAYIILLLASAEVSASFASSMYRCNSYDYRSFGWPCETVYHCICNAKVAYDNLCSY